MLRQKFGVFCAGQLDKVPRADQITITLLLYENLSIDFEVFFLEVKILDAVFLLQDDPNAQIQLP